MTRKYLRERQARKLQEGRQDAAARCTFCKRALPSSGAILGWYGGIAMGRDVKFCNESCAADFDEVQQMEARR